MATKWNNHAVNSLAQLFLRQVLMLRFSNSWAIEGARDDRFKLLLDYAASNASGHVLLLLDAIGAASEYIGSENDEFQDFLAQAQSKLLKLVKDRKINMHHKALALAQKKT